jgi:hypothetical protein
MKKKLATAVAVTMAACLAFAQEEPSANRPERRPGGEGGERGMGMQGRMMDRPGMEGMRGREHGGGMGGGQMGGGPERGDMMERLLSNPQMLEKLGISEETANQMKSDLDKINLEMIDLKAAMEKIGLKQASAMTAKEVDEDALMDMVEEGGEIRTKMAKLQIRKMMIFRKNIDPEKMEQARNQLRERMQERFGDGEGRMQERGMGGRGQGLGEERRKKIEEFRRRSQGEGSDATEETRKEETKEDAKAE